MNETENTSPAPVPAVEARIDKMPDANGKTKAFASVVIGGSFAVHGLRVIETGKGRFIAMPQDSYNKNGEKSTSIRFTPSPPGHAQLSWMQ